MCKHTFVMNKMETIRILAGQNSHFSGKPKGFDFKVAPPPHIYNAYFYVAS